MGRLERWPHTSLPVAGSARSIRAAVASLPHRRLIGLACLRSPGPLLLPDCGAVHTLGMRVRIDVAFLLPGQDGELVVTGLRPALRPARSAIAGHRPAWTLELPAGGAEEAGIVRGSVLGPPVPVASSRESGDRAR